MVSRWTKLTCVEFQLSTLTHSGTDPIVPVCMRCTCMCNAPLYYSCIFMCTSVFKFMDVEEAGEKRSDDRHLRRLRRSDCDFECVNVV